MKKGENNINAINGASSCSSPNFFGRLISKDNILLISRNVIEIGRNSTHNAVDFHISSETEKMFISRKHLILYFDRVTGFKLHVLSKNGIFVNGIFYKQRDSGINLPDKCTLRFPSTKTTFMFESLISRTLALPPEEIKMEPTDFAVEYEIENSSDDNENQANLQGSQKSSLGPVDRTCKPPYSYSQLIIQSISASKNKQLTLAEIYSHVSKMHPYYGNIDQKGWQNSIRHNLSLNSCFMKVHRSAEERGKGSFWRVDPLQESKLVGQCFQKRGHRNPAARMATQQTAAVDVADTQPDLSFEPNSVIIDGEYSHCEFADSIKVEVKRERESNDSDECSDNGTSQPKRIHI